MASFNTPLTELLKIQHPIMLAGMNVAAGPKLAAAVTNAGGIGVIGGVGYTPDMLKKQVQELKSYLNDKKAPFGVDLLLPKVGEGARKTNYDYTGGNLDQLIDIIIHEGAKLFVSAVGVPPKWAVDKLHNAGILVMNMIGSPKHVEKCLEVGCDIICAQGGEGGGHTGEVATSILIPAVVDLCKDKISSFTKRPVLVVAAGGIFDGRGLVSALAMGASGVWVGTRFICTKEAGAPPAHQKAVLDASVHDTFRTLVFTGRPMRIGPNSYAKNWETNRADEMKKLLSQGILPYTHDMEKEDATREELANIMRNRPMLMGQVAGLIKDIPSAEEVINGMISDAKKIVQNLKTSSKL